MAERCSLATDTLGGSPESLDATAKVGVALLGDVSSGLPGVALLGDALGFELPDLALIGDMLGSVALLGDMPKSELRGLAPLLGSELPALALLVGSEFPL